jgi:hypothetical protein
VSEHRKGKKKKHEGNKRKKQGHGEVARGHQGGWELSAEGRSEGRVVEGGAGQGNGTPKTKLQSAPLLRKKKERKKIKKERRTNI